jgi:hypothetical protein
LNLTMLVIFPCVYVNTSNSGLTLSDILSLLEEAGLSFIDALSNLRAILTEPIVDRWLTVDEVDIYILNK